MPQEDLLRLDVIHVKRRYLTYRYKATTTWITYLLILESWAFLAFIHRLT